MERSQRLVFVGTLSDEHRRALESELREHFARALPVLINTPVTVSFLDWSGYARRQRRESRKRVKMHRRYRQHKARLRRWYRASGLSVSSIWRIWGVDIGR